MAISYTSDMGYIFLSPPFLRPCGALIGSTIRHYEGGNLNPQLITTLPIVIKPF